jgi:hypothetical protein
MATMSAADRLICYKKYSDYISSNWIQSKPSKQNYQDAVAAIDQWVEDNKVSFNNAIPEPCKSLMTAQQKAQLLMYVITRRWEVDA